MRVLAVTCHLHLRQNDRDLLRATAVTRGVGTDTEIRVSTESRRWYTDNTDANGDLKYSIKEQKACQVYSFGEKKCF